MGGGKGFPDGDFVHETSLLGFGGTISQNDPDAYAGK
jgi:hypothetical protein